MDQSVAKTGDGPVHRARALLQGGRADLALAGLLPVLQQNADDPAALDCAAMCYWRLGDGTTALALMRVVTDGWPTLAAAWSKRAAMAAGIGDGALAERCLLQALRLTPQSVAVLAALNRVAPFSLNGALTRRLKSQLKDRSLSRADRVMALNALGRIEERAGRHAQAFRRFAAAKAAGDGQYDADATDRRVSAQCARPAVAAGQGGPKVIFVTGMPRSGTTLVESVFDRHPQVTSVGESHALTRARQQAAGGSPQQGRDAYLGTLGLPGHGAERVLVDKMPLNLLDLDFARRILPEARFLFLQRHPLDVGLSCFCTNFHEGNGFSHRLEWIGHLTRAVYRSAEDHEAKLGAAFRRQSYRALVNRPEREIRAMLDHAGLDFHADCLSPEAAQGPARTASLYQVREAINRRGLDKWRAYKAQLTPLVETLGAGWIADWEAADAALTG